MVLAPPTPPQFIRSGSDFNLSCSASSRPPSSFQWFQDQKLLENPGPVLTLQKIQDLGLGTKAGRFSCSATNQKTKRAAASAAVSFTVMGEAPPPPPRGHAPLLHPGA